MKMALDNLIKFLQHILVKPFSLALSLRVIQKHCFLVFFFSQTFVMIPGSEMLIDLMEWPTRLLDGWMFDCLSCGKERRRHLLFSTCIRNK